jgi:hypothetical protein
MPDSTLSIIERATLSIFEQPPVRVVFRPYDHDAVQALLQQVSTEFGRPGLRYRYISPADTLEAIAWTLDFHFDNPHNAIIFGLKDLR